MRNCAGVRLVRRIIAEAIPSECWFWTMARDADGYGRVQWNGARWKAHRLVCALVHGAAPREGLDAAHSCGNGHLGCVNPHHLRWATRKENVADAIGHATHQRGSRNGKSKLREDEILQVRALLATGLSQKVIAAKFSVCVPLISHIKTGRRWAHVR